MSDTFRLHQLLLMFAFITVTLSLSYDYQDNPSQENQNMVLTWFGLSMWTMYCNIKDFTEGL